MEHILLCEELKYIINMKYYLIGSLGKYNAIRFKDVSDWQKNMGYNPKIKQNWESPHMEYIYSVKSKKKFDISTACIPLYTMSSHAIDCLYELISKYGEILPIADPSGFSFFYCTNIIDALIEEESSLNYLDKEKGWISSINHFTLSKEAIKGQDIFRIPQANYRYTFFSENFKELVEKFSLKGIHFDRIEQVSVK